jgi:hypothetical protein
MLEELKELTKAINRLGDIILEKEYPDKTMDELREMFKR